jgi:hypothetical protein
VDPRAGMDDVEKIQLLTLPGFELRPRGVAGRSQSLYRLSYPGSLRRSGERAKYVFYKLSRGAVRSELSCELCVKDSENKQGARE